MHTRVAAALTIAPHGHQASGHVNSPSLGCSRVPGSPALCWGWLGPDPACTGHPHARPLTPSLLPAKSCGSPAGITSLSSLAAAPAEPPPQPR